MNCEYKGNYTSRDYRLVKTLWSKVNRDNSEDIQTAFETELKRRFEPKTASIIVEAVLTGSFSPDFEIKIDSVSDSLVKNGPEELIDSAPETAIDFYVDTQERSLSGFFEKGANDEDYKAVVRDFNTRLLRDLIYNPETGIGVTDPNAPLPGGTFGNYINDKLFNYRLELLKKLQSLEGMPKFEITYRSTPDEIRNIISKVLSAFSTIYRKNLILNDGKGIDKSFYNTYVTLYNFDKLLDELGIVKIRDEYKNTNIITPDRYIYSGERIKYNQSYGKEDANIDDYTSPLVKLVLNEIETINDRGADSGQKITLDGFKYTMNVISDWAWHQNPTSNIFKEVSKGFLCDWEYLISEFVNKSNNYLAKSVAKGIKKHIFSSEMPKTLTDLFRSQAHNTIQAYYLEYANDYINGQTVVKQSIPTERLVDRSAIILNKRLANKINFLQNNSDTRNLLFKNLDGSDKFKVDIKNKAVSLQVPLKNGNLVEVTITYDSDKSKFEYTGAFNGDWSEFNEGLKSIVEQLSDIFIPNDYEETLLGIGAENLMEVFAPVIWLTVFATDPEGSASQIFTWDNNPAKTDRFIKLSKTFGQDLRPAALFLNQLYGYNLKTVTKNLEGNNIPGYQMGSLFFRTFEIISDIKENPEHALSDNTFVRNPGAIVQTNVRESVSINGVTKNVTELCPAEVAQMAIVQDIWNKSRVIKKEDISKIIVDIQPMTYSDKKRQMTKAINISKIKLLSTKNGHPVVLSDIFYSFRNFAYNKNGQKNSDYSESETLLLNEIADVRGRQIKRVVLNYLNKFSRIFGLPELDYINTKYADIITRWDKINSELKTFNRKEDIVKRFRINNLDFADEIDLSETDDKKWVLNPVLLDDVKLYLNDDNDAKVRDLSYFNNYVNLTKAYMVQDLIDEDFTLSVYRDGSLRSDFDNWAQIRPDWVNSYSGNIIMYKLRDANTGKELSNQSLSDFKNIASGNIIVELNPILNTAFYLNLYLGQQLKVLHFGDTWGFKGNTFSSNYSVEEDRAKRFIAQTKRAVIGGGTVSLFTLGLPFGVSDEWRAACIDDLKSSVNDMGGDVHDKELVADGAIYVSPEQAIMENESLLDRRVGDRFKKTLYGWQDENGQLNEVKCAAFTLSNNNRRQNPWSSTYNIEKAFYLMHKDTLPKFIDLNKYYSAGNNATSIESIVDPGRRITHNDYIYFYDNDSGKYYRINGFIQTQTGVSRILQECDETGKLKGAEFTESEISIQSMYDIDRLFGGAWNMKLDFASKHLKFDDSNNKICATILCEENLKNQIIHYIITPSAMKVNVKNINDVAVLQNSVLDPKESLWEFKMNPKYSGVQMDAGHAVEGGHVTEMSQMIQHLIQDGYLVEYVEQIYDAIAEVTKDGRKNYETLDSQTVIKEITDALVKSLYTNNGISTLADSFIKLAAENFEKYKLKIKNPFSDPSIKKKVASVIISNLSQKSLRRTYPGLGTVQAPSYGFMQYFNIKTTNGKTLHMNYMRFCNYMRKILEPGETLEDLFKDRNSKKPGVVTKEYVEKFKNRFFREEVPVGQNKTIKDIGIIEAIDVKDIDFEDTLLIKRKVDDNYDIVKINDVRSYDYWRNIQTDTQYVYRWNTQGRNLLAQTSRIKTSDFKTYNFYDFDEQRRSFYLTEFISKLKDSKYIIQGEQQKYDFIVRKYPKINIKDVNSLQEALKQELKDSRNTFLRYSESLKTNGKFETFQEAFNSQVTRKILSELYNWRKESVSTETILSFLQYYLLGSLDERKAAIQYIKNTPEIQEYFDKSIYDINLNEALGKPDVSRAQVMGGRMFGSKYGISWEYVSDVIYKGPEFFRKKIISSLLSPTLLGFKKLYDLQLHTGNNDNIYVIVGDTEENRKRWSVINSQSDKLKSIDDAIYYNGDYLCDSDGIEVGEFNSNGNKQIMVWVKDNNKLQEFKNSLNPNFVRYNYSQTNIKDLLRDQYYYNFDEDGNLIKEFSISKKFKWELGTNINDINIDPGWIKDIQDRERQSYDKKVSRISKDQYNSFLKSLQGVGARIPSQSMQSYSAIEFIDWIDTEENEIYLPKALTWIAGSDYDIDKFFIMCWSIMNDGTLPVYKHIPGFDIDELAMLPEPSNKTMDVYYTDDLSTADSTTAIITSNELLQWNSGNRFEILREILSKDSKVTFVLTDEELENDDLIDAQDDIFNTVNDYNHTTKKQRKLIKSYSEHIFKNNVVRSLLEALNDPAAQINLLTALNMSAGKELIKKNSSSKEKRMNADNPMSIFIQQYNNMVGRSGISGVAVSQKAFSTISFAIDSRIKKLADKVKMATNDTIEQVVQDIIDSLASITFIGKLHDPSLRSFGNINFRPLIQALKTKGFDIITITDPTKNYSKFLNYIENSQFKIVDFLQMIQDNSNKNNAYDLYSNLMSYATDNAKVLGLDKLNAVGNFIDYYCYLFATGESFNDIGNFMTSPLFNIVRRYSKQNIFEIGSNRVRSKHIIDFILDRDDLPIINKKLFQGSLSSLEFLSFLHKSDAWQEFAKNIISELDIKAKGKYVDQELLWSILNDSEQVVHTSTLTGENDSAKFDYKQSIKFVNAVRRTLKIPEIRDTYLKWLENVINSVADHKVVNQDEVIDFDDDNLWDEIDYSENIAVENNAKFSGWNFDLNAITKDQVRSLYRYITDYLSVKNSLLEKTGLTSEYLSNALSKLIEISNGAEEVSLLGRILAINQGMKGNDFDEFSFISKMESGINRIFINKYKEKYSAESINDWKAFDFIRFMTDSQYQQDLIKQYDKVKTTFNILDVLARSPHFSEMLQTSTVIRKSINLASVSLKLSRKLAKDIFKCIWADKDGNDIGDIVFPGLQYRLTDKEWNELSSAIDDLIIYHFIVKTAQINPELFEFKVPDDFETYNDKAKLDKNRSRFTMDSAIGIANFKRLMDKYIIPRLKMDDRFKDNAFIRMLTLDSVSDPLTKQRKRYYKLAINTDVSENSPAYDLYEQAREGLNKIAFERFDGKTIIDLFYLYNLLVSKENFGNTNFSMIFEDLQNRQVGSNLMDAFHNFVADLDAGDITVKLNEDGSPTAKNVIAYDINDFLWRIITPENAYKFNYAQRTGNTLTVPRKYYGTTNTSKDIDIKGLDVTNNTTRSLSDFVINLPSLYKEYGRLLLPEWEGYKPDIARQEIVNFTAPDVLYEIVRYLQELFGNEVPIRLIDNRDLENYQNEGSFMFRGNLSQEQIDKIKASNGFIDNGIIYINTDKYELSTPIHELGHLICAVLKFNPDKNVKKRYYDLLNAIWEKEKGKYPDIRKITPSDKEELLVEWLGNQFYNEFKEQWSNNAKSPMYSFEIKNLVRSALNTLFKTNVNSEVKLDRLGNTTLEDFLRIFPSELFDLNYKSRAHFRLILNQQLTTLKNKYVEWDCIS